MAAVKAFRLDLTPEQVRALADELQRLVDAGLSHPSIVSPIAAGIEGGTAYLAQEYVAGESLDIAIRHYAPARLDTALPFIAQLAGATDFARAAGFGHGTLHPRDIFLTPDEARATGFGIATVLEALGLQAPVRRPYSAPERVAGEKWGPAADVYSLAAIGYEFLTGRRIAGPVTGPDALELRKAFAFGARLSAADPLVARLLATPLARALAEDPAARYPGALAFARALEAAAEGEEEREIRTAAPEVKKGPEAQRVREVARVREASATANVQPSLVDELDEAAPSVEASAPTPETKPKLRVLEKKREPQPPNEPAPEPEVEPAPEPDVRAEALPEPALERLVDPELDLEIARAAEPTPDLALRPLAGDPQQPAEPIEPLEPLEPLEAMEPVEPSVLHDLRESREPMRVLPLAVMLVAGLLVGFVAGYAVGTRGESAGDSAAVRPAGAAWSEAKVDPAATPPASTPAPAASEPATLAPPAAAPADAPASVPSRGTLVIRSTPARAGVIVDGAWRGRTPLTLSDVPMGRHTVRVAERGYSPENREITLSAERSTQELDVNLEATPTSTTGSTRPAPAPAGSRPEPTPASPSTGSLFVDSRPRGARVFVDGRAAGVTPLQLNDIPVGARLVRLELPNHRSWTDSRRVVAGETTRVTGSLEPIP